MKKILLAILVCLSFNATPANLNRCTLLPILDDLEGAFSSLVQKEVERYLQNSTWCDYHADNRLSKILTKRRYKNKLNSYLDDDGVINVIAKKLNVGSLISMNLTNTKKGVEVNLKIIGENGKDQLYKVREEVATGDPEKLSLQIEKWLEQYGQRIPYKGIVELVQGNRLSFKSYRPINIDNQLLIIRPVAPISHPLLKQIVEWKTESIGKANATDNIRARIVSLTEDRTVRPGDWIVENNVSANRINLLSDDEVPLSSKTIADLGRWGLFVTPTISKATSKVTEDETITGYMAGAVAHGEIFLSENFWADGALGLGFGIANQTFSNLITNTEFTLRLGHKFYLGGERRNYISPFFGYSRYQFDYNTQDSLFFSSTTFDGLLLGIRGDFDLINRYGMEVTLESIYSPEFSDENSAFGKEKSTSASSLEVLGYYNLTTIKNISAGLKVKHASATFDGGYSTSYTDWQVKIGLTEQF